MVPSADFVALYGSCCLGVDSCGTLVSLLYCYSTLKLLGLLCYL